jgi:hypothetical protein
MKAVLSLSLFFVAFLRSEKSIKIIAPLFGRLWLLYFFFILFLSLLSYFRQYWELLCSEFISDSLIFVIWSPDIVFLENKKKENNNCYVLMHCCPNWFSLNCLRIKYQNSVSFVEHVVSDILVLFHRTCETSKVGRLLWQEYNTWPNQEQDIANTTQQNFVIIWSFNIWCSSQTYTVVFFYELTNFMLYYH